MKKIVEEISVFELKKMIDCKNNLILLDVRELYEVKIGKINESIHIPMREVGNRLNELNPDYEIIVQCKSGIRSAQICEFLIYNNFKKVKNLKGGILEWSDKIDNTIPKY